MATPKKCVPKKGMKTIGPSKKGQKPITFKVGGLHESTSTPMDKTIPEAKVEAAASGKMGTKAARQAAFVKNVLSKKKGK